MKFLLDTNVVSEIGKGARRDPNVQAWYDAADPADLSISALVVGELRAGVEKLRRRQSERAMAFERTLILVIDLFADRIIGIDRRVAERWGRITAAGRPPAVDGLIAATAVVHGLVVVTRNVRDFAPSGADVLNPFDPPS